MSVSPEEHQNVRHYVCCTCHIPECCEKQCYVSMCQFQDLGTLYHLNIPLQKNAYSTINRIISDEIESPK